MTKYITAEGLKSNRIYGSARWAEIGIAQPSLAQAGTGCPTAAVLRQATGLSADHQLRTWDAIVPATAADAGCQLLLTEDLQGRFSWAGVTVVNPFAVPSRKLLSALLHHCARRRFFLF
jgi:hypothetical protein